MCINQEISLNTFLFGMFTASLGYGNGVISLPTFLYYISFISMQLVEFFTWRNLRDKDKIYYLSVIGFILVMVQPFLYIYASNLYSKEKNLLLGAYTALVLVIVTIVVPMYKVQFYMKKSENGHLAWYWLDLPLWSLILWFGFLGYVVYRDNEYGKMILWPIVILYIYITYAKTKTWGSLWCWIANAFGFILLYRIFKKSISCVQ